MLFCGSPEEIIPKMRWKLSQGEGFWLTVTGYSMLPTLRHEADKVHISPACGEIRKGDIVLIKLNDKHCLLHRILKFSNGSFYCKGDSQYYYEGPLDASAIIGVVTQIDRNGRVLKLNKLYRLINQLERRCWHLKRYFKQKIC